MYTRKKKEVNVLYKDALNTFLFTAVWCWTMNFVIPVVDHWLEDGVVNGRYTFVYTDTYMCIFSSQ